MSRLSIHEWGTGERIAVLVHGITSDAHSWWRLGPELARRGYRVLAVELPGHGRSPRHTTYTAEAAADALVASVPAEPELLLGHSLGGRVAALAVERLAPTRAVYEDPAWAAGDVSMAAGFAQQKHFDLDAVRVAYPRWAPAAHRHKLEALALWDVATLEALGSFGEHRPGPPPVPSLVLTADVNAIIGPERAHHLAGLGFEVRGVPGAGHNIHNDDFEGFTTALKDWI